MLLTRAFGIRWEKAADGPSCDGGGKAKVTTALRWQEMRERRAAERGECMPDAWNFDMCRDRQCQKKRKREDNSKRAKGKELQATEEIETLMG